MSELQGFTGIIIGEAMLEYLYGEPRPSVVCSPSFNFLKAIRRAERKLTAEMGSEYLYRTIRFRSEGHVAVRVKWVLSDHTIQKADSTEENACLACWYKVFVWWNKQKQQEALCPVK
ncbi:hypothetical protein LCGC14_2205840 [marine sediment metagenome]|uniref:Uncharacterized protein n=1 Tax=marine sediment metagenome TaxID=412755 RepID=A0A0F9DF84_9ZZZZ